MKNTVQQTEKPDWLNGTVCPTGRFRVKQGWAGDFPISVLQEFVRSPCGHKGWWLNVPSVALDASDAEYE